MKISNGLVATLLVCLALGGCATSRSVLDVAAPGSPSQIQPNGKTVLINLPRDVRVFQVSPPSPDIPSLDPSEQQTDAIRLRAVGRKRNTFGKALGDILLAEGKTVETLTSAAIAKAFSDKGYRVIANKSEAAKDTFVVDATINQFWAWMNPGFWAITLSAEISTDLAVKSLEGSEVKKVSVKASDNYQIATDGNWMEVVDNALRLYVDDLKSKLK